MRSREWELMVISWCGWTCSPEPEQCWLDIFTILNLEHQTNSLRNPALQCPCSSVGHPAATDHLHLFCRRTKPGTEGEETQTSCKGSLGLGKSHSFYDLLMIPPSPFHNSSPDRCKQRAACSWWLLCRAKSSCPIAAVWGCSPSAAELSWCCTHTAWLTSR